MASLFFSLISDGLGGVARDVNRLTKYSAGMQPKRRSNGLTFYKHYLVVVVYDTGRRTRHQISCNLQIQPYQNNQRNKKEHCDQEDNVELGPISVDLS